MEILQLKDIAGYLPYNLIVQSKNTYTKYFVRGFDEFSKIGGQYMICIEKLSDRQKYDIAIENLKPILRPMSDLKKQLPDGTVPLIELAKMVFTNQKNFKIKGNRIQVLNDYFVVNEFFWDKNEFRKIYFKKGIGLTVENQIQLFDYLHEHMFDYRGLIDRNLAIDINTMKI